MFSTTSCRRRAGSGCIARLATPSASTRSRSLTSPSFAHHFVAAAPAETSRRRSACPAGRREPCSCSPTRRPPACSGSRSRRSIFSRPLILGPNASLIGLGDALARAGDFGEAKRTFLQAAENAKAPEMLELLARAALGYGGRFVWEPGRGDPHLLPLLEDALAALPKTDSEPGQGRVLAAGGPLATCRPPRVGGPRSASKQSRRHEDSETHRLSRMPSTAAAWRSGAHTRRSRSAMRSRQSSSRWPRPRETRSSCTTGTCFGLR